jgi:hypothetical protein
MSVSGDECERSDPMVLCHKRSYRFAHLPSAVSNSQITDQGAAPAEHLKRAPTLFRAGSILFVRRRSPFDSVAPASGPIAKAGIPRKVVLAFCVVDTGNWGHTRPGVSHYRFGHCPSRPPCRYPGINRPFLRVRHVHNVEAKTVAIRIGGHRSICCSGEAFLGRLSYTNPAVNDRRAPQEGRSRTRNAWAGEECDGHPNSRFGGQSASRFL